jgi:archaellum biogenesis protein FlaJ (TadC family)
MNITFADLLTPAGVTAFAAVVTTLIALLKQTFPGLDARVSGALMAFVLTAIGYVLCGAATGVPTLDAALLVFISWLGCASAAVGIHSAVQHLTSAPPDPQP